MSEPQRMDALPMGQDRGTMGMILVITTEGLLFVVMLFGYLYEYHERQRWPPEPPKLMWPLIMLGVLLTSSGVLFVAEHLVKRGADALAKGCVVITMLLGLVFLGLQGNEYHTRLHELQPTTNAYGSYFYTITSIHGLHVLTGLFFLLYVLFLPRIGPTHGAPHRALKNAGLYWHFVDTVWIVIVLLLYVIPRAQS